MSKPKLIIEFRHVIGLTVVIMSFLMLFVVIFKVVDDNNRDIAMYVLATCNSMLLIILNFEFGGSSGGRKVMEAMTKQMFQPDNPDTEKVDVDTFYRLGDCIWEDGVEYECILEYTTSQAVTPASLDPIHWKKK